ncbi:MAG: VanW family protein [Syntrophomonadaceae bacterium]
MITFFISFSSLAVWMDRLERDLKGVKSGVSIAGHEVGGLLPLEVRQVVHELALQYHRCPLEPRIDRTSGQIIAEQPGTLLDIAGCEKLIMNAGPGEQLEVLLLPVSPRHSSEEIAAANRVVGSYQTWVSGSYQRYTNVSMASRGINNVLLWPGEQFSFNDIVGPRSLERGYLPAPIILMGSDAMDFGGGVCQVASTLYNAALAAGLSIDERHGHTREIHYVPPGRDATVTYGDLDLCFSNNQDGPVIIRSALNGNRLWVKIMGR